MDADADLPGYPSPSLPPTMNSVPGTAGFVVQSPEYNSTFSARRLPSAFFPIENLTRSPIASDLNFVVGVQ
jgi:hypothetical protein